MSFLASSQVSIHTLASLLNSMDDQSLKLTSLNEELESKQSCLVALVAADPNLKELPVWESTVLRLRFQMTKLNERLTCIEARIAQLQVIGPKPATSSPGSQAGSSASGDR